MTHILASTDYVGIAAVIAAVFSGIAAVIAAANGRTVRDVHRQVGTNGDPAGRTLGEIASDLGNPSTAPAPATEPAPPPPVAGPPGVTPALGDG